MNISENSVEHLQQWKTDIEQRVRTNPELWETLHPLYSQISFWIIFKTSKDIKNITERNFNLKIV